MERTLVLAIVSRIVAVVCIRGCTDYLYLSVYIIIAFTNLFALQVLAVVLLIVSAVIIGNIDNNPFFINLFNDGMRKSDFRLRKYDYYASLYLCNHRTLTAMHATSSLAAAQ